jgi:hypothetical protein
MDDCETALTVCLTEAGFDRDTQDEAVRIFESGNKNDLKQFLRSKRCNLIEQMHESQKRIDRVDYLIRQIGEI